MAYQCKHCHGYGVYKVKRTWWQRLLRRANGYRCNDCGANYQKKELELEPANTRHKP